jgi:hypothetical protein
MENLTEQKNARIHKIFFIISLIPLGIYPIILLANFMSLLGHRSGNEPLSLKFAAYSFLIFSTLYPVTLIYSKTKNKQKIIIISALPLIHLFISILLFIIWMSIEDNYNC